MKIQTAAWSVAGAARTVIACPIDSAFDFVGGRFFENYTRWSPQIVEFEPLTQGPARRGAQARQVMLDRGVRVESMIEIADFDPPRRLRVKGLSEPFSAQYAFESRGDGATELSFACALEQRNLFLKPFDRLVRATLQEGAERTIDNLKRLLEGARAVETTRERLAQFVYVASLDLQEPLRKIDAFAHLLDNAVASGNRADMAYAQDAVRACAATARKLVDDLLTYSGAILGEQKLERLDLETEIKAVLTALAEPLAETRAELRLDVTPTPIRADRRQFACLMENIVSNAIKYRKPGALPEISIDAARLPQGDTRLVVADAGVGFSGAFAAAIFEPFRRLPGHSEYAGAGIELAICKSIADRHGWGIAVTSAPGEGASFAFTLPPIHEETAEDGA